MCFVFVCGGGKQTPPPGRLVAATEDSRDFKALHLSQEAGSVSGGFLPPPVVRITAASAVHPFVLLLGIQ